MNIPADTIARSDRRSLLARAVIGAALLVLIAAVFSLMLPHRFGPDAPPRTRLVAFTPAQPGDQQPSPAGETGADTQHDGIRECIITLITGRTITGELISQNDETVVISINDIPTTFQRKNVSSVRILAPVSERYKQLRRAIPDDEIDARLSLVEWLRARRAYELALLELDEILEIEPLNPRAKLLHTWLLAHRKLEKSEPDSEKQDDAEEDDPKDSRSTRRALPQRNDIEPLSAQEINLMRVYEIDLSDPPRFRVPDQVLEELMKRSPDAFSPDRDERDAVFKLPQIEKLRLLFTQKARDLYSRIEVLEDPKSIHDFRIQVHSQGGWLINACASTRCHGGTDAGRLRLINQRPNSEETVYTNLFILEQYRLDDGSPLIDYKDPVRSPLLQMGMVPKNSLRPHPELSKDFPGPGFRPIFRTTRERKYQDALEWIRSMYQPRPDYGFEPRIQSEPQPEPPEEVGP